MGKIKPITTQPKVPMNEQQHTPVSSVTDTLDTYHAWLKYHRKEGEAVLSEEEFYRKFPLGTVSAQLQNIFF